MRHNRNRAQARHRMVGTRRSRRMARLTFWVNRLAEGLN